MLEIWTNELLPQAFEKLPQVQKIAQSGHTATNPLSRQMRTNQCQRLL